MIRFSPTPPLDANPVTARAASAEKARPADATTSQMGQFEASSSSLQLTPDRSTSNLLVPAKRKEAEAFPELVRAKNGGSSAKKKADSQNVLTIRESDLPVGLAAERRRRLSQGLPHAFLASFKDNEPTQLFDGSVTFDDDLFKKISDEVRVVYSTSLSGPFYASVCADEMRQDEMHAARYLFTPLEDASPWNATAEDNEDNAIRMVLEAMFFHGVCVEKDGQMARSVMRGVSFDASWAAEQEALVLAVEAKNVALVEHFLRKGVTPSARTHDGWEAMRSACGKEDHRILQALLLHVRTQQDRSWVLNTLDNIEHTDFEGAKTMLRDFLRG
jgi:hypothetical protein